MYTTPFTPTGLPSRTPRSTLALAGLLLLALSLYRVSSEAVCNSYYLPLVRKQ